MRSPKKSAQPKTESRGKERKKSPVEELVASTELSRTGGDGESGSETPHLENSPPRSPVRERSKEDDGQLNNGTLAGPAQQRQEQISRVSSPSSNPFEVEFHVDLMAVFLFVTGVFTRMVLLDKPNHVVFDEMHYGRYASMYLKNTFFFDSNPPLGKLMIGLAGYLVGFDGEFGFDKIGFPYEAHVPVWTLRAIPALCGSAFMPTIYLIMCEIGLSKWAGALAGIFVLLDTALLTQSRFILLDSIMILFALWAVYSVLRFRRHQEQPFSVGWWAWLTLASVNMGLAFCVKYLAIYSCWLCTWLLLQELWRRLPNKTISNWQLIGEFAVQIVMITAIPAALYVGCFYVHLKLLTKAGVHDALMTSAFQASLEGGLSSIVQSQPLEIAHGSQITLRHTHGKTCWLHSHEAVYPVRYEDGRGSSHQQQISCYSYKDVNNWWIVKKPDREDLAVHEPLEVIKDGDIIQLVHGMTHRALNSHDVAAPMSPHNQEVTCYIDYNISMVAENLWKVDIVNSPQSGDVWHSIGSQVRLIHMNTKQALKYSPKLYPEWGFNQNEVVADKVVDQIDTVWNVEEHRYTKNDEDKKSLERELYNHELIPQKATYLSFFDKFLELQLKMLLTNQENVQNHNYASDPSEWPFLTRGIAYFIAKESNAQVHLLGNPIVWYTATLAMLTYLALLALYILRRRRRCFDIPEDVFEQFVRSGEVLLGGYLFHYLPFFFYDRTLFLHHYLTAYVYKVMLAGFVVSHVSTVISHLSSSRLAARAFQAVVCIWLALAAVVFWKFSVFCYGAYPLSADEVRALRWKDTWDLIIHKP